MAEAKKYQERDFSRVKGLSGISDAQIAEHLKLYAGYVKRTNALTERLQGLCLEGKASGADPGYAELTRRLGFEYNGMILHELYFEALAPGGAPEPPQGSRLRRAIEASFGKVETWLADFRAVAAMPGIGWAALFQDPRTGWLSNHWLTLHSDGSPAGYAPILVLDEATSSLDSEVEAAIQEQLLGLMEGKTVIAIAHRLSTIARMDRLIVLEAGRIVEQGTHAELLALGGHYEKLWRHQSGGFLAESALPATSEPDLPEEPLAEDLRADEKSGPSTDDAPVTTRT